MNRLARTIFLFAAICTARGCQSDSVLVVVVSGVPVQAASLRVLVHLDSDAAESPLELPVGQHAGSGSSSFGLRLPAAGIGRELRVGIAAVDAQHCILAVGSQREPALHVRAEVQGEQQTTVELIPVAPTACGTDEPRLLQVNPAQVSTLGADVAGQSQPLQIFGWKLTQETKIFIHGKSAPVIGWRSGVELSVQPPVLSGVLGAVAVGLGSQEGRQTGRSDLLSLFAGQLDFDAIRALGAAGSTKAASTVGDFNDDGYPDVAFAYYRHLQVLLGDGAGGFPTTLAHDGDSQLGEPFMLRAAHLRQKSALDLLSSDSGTSCALLAKGTGRFASCSALPILGFSDVQAADFNGDKRPDLVMSNGAASYISYGDGFGGFSKPTQLTRLVYSVQPLEAGNLNGDDKSDLLILDRKLSAVSVFVGTAATGLMPVEPALAFAAPALSVALGDLDGDQWPDLAVGQRGGISLLTGTGDGHFTPLGQVDMPGDDVYHIQFVPLAARPWPALVLVGYQGSSVSHKVWIGDGLGSFRLAQQFPVPDEARRGQTAGIGDFNGDGRPDMVLAGSSRHVLHLGRGDGTFRTTPSVPLSDVSCCVAVGNLDANAALDLVVARSGAVDILWGDGIGGFALQSGAADSVPSAVSAVTVADLNGDGRDDVLLASGTTLHVLLSDAGLRLDATYDVGNQIVKMALVDVDCDRNLDVVLAADGALKILHGDGRGHLRHGSTLPGLMGVKEVAVGHVNADPWPDLVLMNGSSVSVQLGRDATGDNYQQDSPYSTLAGCLGMVLADLDGDQLLDVGIARMLDVGLITLMRGTKSGRFETPMDIFEGDVPGALLTADVNGDGKLDLLSTNKGTVEVLLNLGSRKFAQALMLGEEGAAGTIAVGDFNRDRLPDFVSLAGRSLHVVLNTSR